MDTDKIWSAEDIDAAKVAAVDLGGTLVASDEMGSTSHEVNTALGIDKQKEERIYRSHKDHDEGIEDYMEHAIEITKAINQSKRGDYEDYAEVVQDLIQDRELLEGAASFIESLEEKGYHTVAVSSSPAAISYPLAEDLGFSSFYVFRDYIFHENEFRGVYVNPRARKGKQGFIKELQEEGIDVFYAGNGGNDVKAEDAADTGVRRWDWVANPEKAYEEALRAV